MGLGNPGREYSDTRHNVGWWVVDHLADVWRFDSWKKDQGAHTASGSVGGVRVRLIKPQTYMNLSGEALRSYVRRPFWSSARDLLVVVDEVQIPVGRYRFRAKGSAGGHNGLKSVESHLHTQDYARLRVGVGPDDEHRSVAALRDYVLGSFGKNEAKVIRDLLPLLADGIETWIAQGMLDTMNRFPGRPPADPTP